MRRLPLIPTIVVALAVAAMIALGIWQLGRAREKEALIALYRANLSKPAIAFSQSAADPAGTLFRRAAADCLTLVPWDRRGGRAIDGSVGYRHLVRCRLGGIVPAAMAPDAFIDIGVSTDPDAQPRLPRGPVRISGIVTMVPDGTSLIGRLAGGGVAATPMLVADAPAPGLRRSAPPGPESIPNNHLAYAVQWFLFALAAAAIYALAVRRRVRTQAAGRGTTRSAA